MSNDVCRINFVDQEKVARLREAMIPTDALQRMADMFRVLGDATRVRMLHALSLEELCVCDLVALLGTSQSAVSHQLRLLRAWRLVTFRKAGKMVYYCLDDEHVRSLFAEALKHTDSSGDHPERPFTPYNGKKP